ncbi:MAG: hypothetical protein ACREIU_06645 [Planctomycetota bacterium]
MNRLPLLLLAAASCRAAPVPVPESEAVALEQAVRRANPPLPGYRASGTLTVEGDFFLSLVPRRNLDFVAAGAPGRSFVLLRQPFGTVLKAGAVEGLLWVIVTMPEATLYRRSLLGAKGPAPVLLARDLLLAFDLCVPLPARLSFQRTEEELLGVDGEDLYAFDPETLRLRRRVLRGVRVEQEGSGPLPDRLVVRGMRMRERVTVRIESVTPEAPGAGTFEPGPTGDLKEGEADA